MSQRHLPTEVVVAVVVLQYLEKHATCWRQTVFIWIILQHTLKEDVLMESVLPLSVRSSRHRTIRHSRDDLFPTIVSLQSKGFADKLLQVLLYV